ncbi:hypothetical protein BHE74_00050324 [Ensete ventricosum]|nr:hypothetical protein BHE74_00050324 [Ensete ventricosum]
MRRRLILPRGETRRHLVPTQGSRHRFVLRGETRRRLVSVQGDSGFDGTARSKRKTLANSILIVLLMYC